MPQLRKIALILLLPFLLLPECLAFELPLTDHSIREAYFLGQHHDASTESALKPYLHKLSPPEKGPYISDIRILTPYSQVIEASHAHGGGYSAQQAAADYHAHPDEIVVRFQIRFTPTYSYIKSNRNRGANAPAGAITVRSEDFWQSFKAGLSQNDHSVEPLSREGEPIFIADTEGGSVLDGAYIWLIFDANEVASDMVTAEIFTPDGQRVTSDFDLATLR